MCYDSHITGTIICKLRREKGLSQEVLSGLSGMTRSHLSMIENGRISASIETLWKISEALDIKFSDFIKKVELLQSVTHNTQKEMEI